MLTGSELVGLLQDSEVRQNVKDVLGLPSEAVAEALANLAAAQTRTDASVRELAAEMKELAVAQARTDASVKELAAEMRELAAAQARTDATVQELVLANRRLEHAQKELRQAVSALPDNVGFSLEELTAMVLPGVVASRPG